MFSGMVDEWKRILIVEGDSRRADEYYLKYLFRRVSSIVKGKSGDLIGKFRVPRFLVLTVGRRWKPLALTLSVLEPVKVYWIVTRGSVDVARIAGGNCRRVFDFNFDEEFIRVDGSDLTEIYACIWEILRGLEDVDYGSIIINATGGTKPMTCGAMIAGFIARYLDYRDCYVVYLRGLERRENGVTYVEPGSEELILVENPFQSFGDFIIMKAKDIACNYGFEMASNELNKLLRTIEWITMRELARFYMEIFNAYIKWEFERELRKARDHLLRAKRIIRYREVRRRISSDELMVLDDNLRLIENLIDIVGKLNSNEKLSVLSNPDMIIPLMANLFVSGIRRIEMNKFDEAALIFYRIMELCSQSLLAKYGIDTSNATFESYSKAIVRVGFRDLNEFKNRYVMVVNEIGRLIGEKLSVELPSKIPLITGLLILKAFNDKFIDMIDFKELFDAINIRNLCWLEHGFQRVSEKGANKLKNITLKMIRAYINSWGRKDLNEKFKEAMKMSKYISEKIEFKI